MRILIFQHTPEETPGTLLHWLKQSGVSFKISHLYLHGPFPSAEDFEAMVVLGGPMNLNQTTEYPWLILEKKFIADWIQSGKRYLGICLGAQILAQVLGADVGKNSVREIGYHRIEKLPAVPNPDFFSDWPKAVTVAQWHEDRFTLPPSTLPLFTSSACTFQGFQKGDRIVALQFHPEATQAWMNSNYVGLNRETHEPFVLSIEENKAIQKVAQPVMQNLFFRFLDRFFIENEK